MKRRDLMLGLVAAAWSASGEGHGKDPAARSASLPPIQGFFAALDLERDFSEYSGFPAVITDCCCACDSSNEALHTLATELLYRGR